MEKLICTIGISFLTEEKPFIAMGQVGHKVDRIVDEKLSAFQYTAESEEELKKILHDFVDDQLKSYLEVKQVREAGDPEPLPPNEFNDNINANKNGVYNLDDILQKNNPDKKESTLE